MSVRPFHTCVSVQRCQDGRHVCLHVSCLPMLATWTSLQMQPPTTVYRQSPQNPIQYRAVFISISSHCVSSALSGREWSQTLQLYKCLGKTWAFGVLVGIFGGRNVQGTWRAQEGSQKYIVQGTWRVQLGGQKYIVHKESANRYLRSFEWGPQNSWPSEA